ncbi:NAD synthetase [Kiloniella litopenaei]|uniref:proton-translocating NAD(P)(+) transhydrogenase n=1 Tax=Kiloniella litopenaei TaxID=1549748 RepID=A0A0M2R9J1_9PROT|nr:NAD(P) transhydrogenase subunit alpha [Kiloniella litopenaei]KKJ76253.1 NAD synthetase [Kiloniella litopenaei]
MSSEEFINKATEVANSARALSDEVASLASEASRLAVDTAGQSAGSPFIMGLTVLVLAVFVGYYVVWNVTPALHSPLMAVTNAISSVIIVGALIAAGPADLGFSEIMGFIAIVLAAVNIFGGFIVAQRMLQMFKKKQ